MPGGGRLLLPSEVNEGGLLSVDEVVADAAVATGGALTSALVTAAGGAGAAGFGVGFCGALAWFPFERPFFSFPIVLRRGSGSSSVVWGAKKEVAHDMGSSALRFAAGQSESPSDRGVTAWLGCRIAEVQDQLQHLVLPDPRLHPHTQRPELADEEPCRRAPAADPQLRQGVRSQPFASSKTSDAKQSEDSGYPNLTGKERGRGARRSRTLCVWGVEE